MISSKRRKLTRREIAFITVLISVILTAAIWNIFGIAIYGEVSSLRAELNRLSILQEEESRIIADKLNITNDWENWLEERDYFNQALPLYSKMPHVLGSLEHLLNTYPGSVKDFRIGETSENDRFITVAVTLALSGTKYQVDKVIDDLEMFPYTLIIETADWATADKLQTDLKLNFNLIFLNPSFAIDENIL